MTPSLPPEPPFAAQPLFGDPAIVATFPAPIGEALATMVHEIVHSGEETTPDETSIAIEATFQWLGRVWGSEYLAAVGDARLTVDEPLNRELFERLLAGRALMMGQWVGLARRVRAAMVGVPTVVEGLAEIDFGDLGDDAHPVARLIAFRNEFAHGSFHAPRARIREHRQLLHDLLARVPALRTQAVLCLEPESTTVRAARAGWPVVEEGRPLPALHPIVFAADGQRRLDLYPLLHASFGEDPQLCEPTVLHPIASLAEHEALRAWLARYDRERAGHIPWKNHVERALSLDAQALVDVREALATPRPGLVFVEVPPGSGGDGLIDACTSDDPLALGLGRYAAIARIAVRDGDPSQSGFTIANAALRLSERALGERDGSRVAAITTVLARDGALATASAALAGAGKRVLLALEGLQRGQTPYRGEPFTVRATYEALSGSAFDVLAVCEPGSIAKPLYDTRIAAAPASAPERAAVIDAARRLLTTPLHGRVLRQIVEATEPLDLFALCDALEERGGDVVFEPAVERALWDLRPVLDTARQNLPGGLEAPIRTWSVFAESARAALAEVVA